MESRVILPLYIYPSPGAWEPLYAAISKYPNLQFLIILNPNNGPGEAPWWPNEDYVREIPRLNAHTNVTLVGYVYATYCQRSADDVFLDIQTYAERGKGWLSVLGVQGIFVDETVNLYSEKMKGYLDAIDQQVKKSEGIVGNKIVIHNPGTAVSSRLASPGPDITVVVETSYQHFITQEYQDWLATSPYDRSRSCYMLHSVPNDEVKNLTASFCKAAKYLFITSATENFYGSFGPSWEDFLAAMEASGIAESG
ncbi:Spherulation-specific family 4 [Pyrenochaeta sp. MPI-SDFR-AT-0127]|nr:Spherulation-specific family 4 [Pyrenochaeta sp. MPI-SDFR-AT-0127]